MSKRRNTTETREQLMQRIEKENAALIDAMLRLIAEGRVFVYLGVDQDKNVQVCADIESISINGNSIQLNAVADWRD